MTEEEFYQAGYAAHHRGQSWLTHPEGSGKNDWIRGWNAGQDDFEKDLHPPKVDEPFKIFELRRFKIIWNGYEGDEHVGFFSTREKAEAEAVNLGIDINDSWSGSIQEAYVR